MMEKSGGTTNTRNEATSPTTNTSNETTSPTNNTSNETTSPTSNTTTTRSNDTYVYGVGILAVLAIGACIFLYITLPRPNIKNKPMKKRINHENNVICFRKIYSK